MTDHPPRCAKCRHAFWSHVGDGLDALFGAKACQSCASRVEGVQAMTEPWKGDHGFTGVALVAWRRQRQAQLDLIAHDFWRTSKDAKERGWYVLLKVARNACPCPQNYGAGGTPEGAEWVRDFENWPVEPDLGGMDLSYANLTNANLAKANLVEASLYMANLSGADLSGAKLSEADLSLANLSSANLTGARLYLTSLWGGYLCKANLRGANLVEADLSGTDLSTANLSGANLTGASLYMADLSMVDLSDANLSGANLGGANLGGWERGPDGYAQKRVTPQTVEVS